MSGLVEFLLARVTEDEERLPSRITLHSASQRRLRAECEAKRRIVDRARVIDDALHYDAHWVINEVLRDLGAIYRDHPDFDERWLP